MPTTKRTHWQKLRGGNWNSERVSDILKNEKYIGNALLQKKYVIDHLSKSLVFNKGALPQYYAEDTHCAIIDKDTFNKAKEIMIRNREYSKGKKEAGKYAFTSKIECSKCGKNYKRKTSNGRIYWSCGTYLKYGKDSCDSKQISERILISEINEVMERPDFDEELFDRLIERIVASEINKMTFVFRDGHSVEKAWANRSRSESWTDEMKQRARDNSVERRTSQCAQQNQ